MSLLLILTVFAVVLSGVFILVLRSTVSIRLACTISREDVVVNLQIDFLSKELWAFSFSGEKWGAFLEKSASAQKKPSDKTQKDGDCRRSPLQEWRSVKARFIQTVRTLERAKSLEVHDFFWRTSFGLGQAARTASFCGLIWSFKSIVIAPFRERIVGTPRVEVIPQYQKKQMLSSLTCMITVRAGDAITIIRQLRQQMKG